MQLSKILIRSIADVYKGQSRPLMRPLVGSRRPQCSLQLYGAFPCMLLNTFSDRQTALCMYRPASAYRHTCMCLCPLAGYHSLTTVIVTTAAAPPCSDRMPTVRSQMQANIRYCAGAAADSVSRDTWGQWAGWA